MKNIHYLNGKFVTEEELLISPRDLGFTRGYAVFDFFRTYNHHRPFMFDYHIDRLYNSAKVIGLSMPWTKSEVKHIILATLSKNDTSQEYAVRIIASGGNPSANMTSLVVIIDDVMIFPKSMYENGVKISTVQYKRNIPESKTTQYIEAIKNTSKMQSEGSDEMLYIYNDHVFEGAYSNFFCVVNNTLVTAKDGILPGITRHLITEKFHTEIPIEIRDLTHKEMKSATEAFISVSGKGIVPVVKVDNALVGDGKVGPVTKNIITQFNDFVLSNEW